MNFAGDYTAKLDDKMRLVLPAAFREKTAALSPDYNKLVVRKNIMGKYLDIMLVDAWYNQRREVEERLDLYDEQQHNFWIQFIGDTFELVPDEKTGRISIPKKLLEEIEVDKEVIFVGCGNRINVWSTEEYKRIKTAIAPDKFKQMAKEFLGKKINN
jgi:MraZ protein